MVKRFLVAALVVGALFAPACKLKNKASADEKSAKAEDKQSAGIGATAASSSSGGDSTAAKTDAAGKFKYMLDPAKKADLKKYEALFKPGSSRLETVVNAMGVYALPKDVPVVARECGRINAYYAPDKHAISLCYELADAFYTSFLKLGAQDKEASKLTLDAYTFTMLHEMGHALIGELGLGVSGGEEDNADDLAGLILIQNKKPDWAIAGPYAILQLTKGSKPAYFDEHSMSEQRIGNILCMIYGSNPKEFGGIMEKNPELRPRAPKCPKEYSQRDKFWTQALASHTRKAG